MQFLRWINPLVRIAAGVIGALAVLELAVRVVASPGAAPRADAAADSFASDIIERRQIDEGFAISHYSVHGARLTSHASLADGPTAVVIGDSYVLAEQVADRHTMGARLEELAREAGLPLNVRQYGWSGASPAQYLYVAGEVMRRWNPLRVYVVLSSNDFDRNALLFASPRIRVPRPDSVRLVGEPVRPGYSRPTRASVLMMLARHRWMVIQGRSARRAAAGRGGVATPPPMPEVATMETPPDSAEYARTPEAVVHALGRAFGPRVTLVYLAETGLRGDSTPETSEALMLGACQRFGVDCASTRASMIDARRRGRVGHGAGIAPLGNGHLNAAGHDVVGRVLWSRLSVTGR